jgi:hypothetical protein
MPAPNSTQPASYDAPPASSSPSYGGGFLPSAAAVASTNPATAPPPTTVPASLSTEAGSYRPGSTGSGGVQAASYDQPAYGNTYLR